jgi:hypothetical protein
LTLNIYYTIITQQNNLAPQEYNTMFDTSYFKKNTRHLVEVNSFISSVLWEKYSKKVTSWRGWSAGFSETVGYINNKPICVSVFFTMIDGDWIGFYEPTSQMVDYSMVDDHLKKHFPKAKKYYPQDFNDLLNNTRYRKKDSVFSLLNIDLNLFTSVSFSNPHLNENEIIEKMKFDFN